MWPDISETCIVRRCPRLTRGFDLTDRSEPGLGTSQSYQVGHRSPSTSLQIKLGTDWILRTEVRDPCLRVGAATSDMWISLFERITDGPRSRRWAVFLVVNEVRSGVPGREGVPAWELSSPGMQARALSRAFKTALIGPSPMVLLERFSRGDVYWPTMRAADARTLGLHDPMLMTCRALLRLEGEEGDGIRSVLALGDDFNAVSGPWAGYPLRTRLAAHAAEESVRCYSELLSARLREWAPNGLTYMPHPNFDLVGDRVQLPVLAHDFQSYLFYAQGSHVDLDRWGLLSTEAFTSYMDGWFSAIEAGPHWERSDLVRGGDPWAD